MLQNVDLDIVTIVTRPKWMYGPVMEAMNSNEEGLREGSGLGLVFNATRMWHEQDLKEVRDEEGNFIRTFRYKGLTETGLARVVRAGHKLLGLETFFTVGPKEVRAWTIPAGATAQESAGVIHTDFARGFIAAETIGYDDYISLGGEQAAKDAGKMRQEGHDYKIRDGDVLLFRFNV